MYLQVECILLFISKFGLNRGDEMGRPARAKEEAKQFSAEEQRFISVMAREGSQACHIYGTVTWVAFGHI